MNKIYRERGENVPRHSYLTKKQRDFAELILEGKTQREAYKAVYNTKSHNLKRVDKDASILARSPLVSEYIKKRQEELSQVSGITKEAMLNELLYCIEKTKNATDKKYAAQNIQALNKSIEIISRMMGYNEPERVENTGDITIISNIPRPHKHE